MTILTAGALGVDMSSFPARFSADNNITSATTSQVTVTMTGGDTEVFTGTIQLSGGTPTGGSITGYSYYVGGSELLFSLSGFNVSVEDLKTAGSSNDPLASIKLALAGHDTYNGSAGTDVLIGYGGNDTFNGGSGTEFFEPGAGANTINGGSGVDTVIFQGPSSAYNIADPGSGSITVTDSVPSRNGTDQIANVQFLRFTDKTIFALTPTEARIALLYQGTLGRTPDAPGLVGWEKAFATEPGSARDADNFTALAGTPVSGLPNLAYGFTTSQEFQQKYGALTDTQFVTQLYANVLDRSPDAPGLQG